MTEQNAGFSRLIFRPGGQYVAEIQPSLAHPALASFPVQVDRLGPRRVRLVQIGEGRTYIVPKWNFIHGRCNAFSFREMTQQEREFIQ